VSIKFQTIWFILTHIKIMFCKVLQFELATVFNVPWMSSELLLLIYENWESMGVFRRLRGLWVALGGLLVAAGDLGGYRWPFRLQKASKTVPKVANSDCHTMTAKKWRLWIRKAMQLTGCLSTKSFRWGIEKIDWSSLKLDIFEVWAVLVCVDDAQCVSGDSARIRN
jgi:hypothetical protein